MDWASLLTSLLGAVDLVLVAGIILFVAAVRWVLDGFRIPLSDAVIRLSVLVLGVGCAFLKIDYKHGFLAEALDLVRLAFAYGGAATLTYQLYRAAAKAKKSSAVGGENEPPDQGMVG